MCVHELNAVFQKKKQKKETKEDDALVGFPLGASDFKLKCISENVHSFFFKLNSNISKFFTNYCNYFISKVENFDINQILVPNFDEYIQLLAIGQISLNSISQNCLTADKRRRKPLELVCFTHSHNTLISGRCNQTRNTYLIYHNIWNATI